MHRHRLNRRGLSTLELVFALPILLFLMALMVNFGVVACWKIRGLSAARNAVWATRWPRSGATDPRPAYWPPAAGLGAGGVGNLPALDDPRPDQPVARGPFVGNFRSAALVNSDLLDPARGLRQGSAALTRRFAMMAKMGWFNLNAETFLLDGRWPYRQMSWLPPGETETYALVDNLTPRIPVIYQYDKKKEMSVAYVQAVMAILNAPFRNALKPLDQDDEFIAYRGSAPDFYPRLRQFCTVDDAVAQERVTDLIDRIQGKDKPHVSSVAERMTRAFINLYRQMIDSYQGQINALPPGSNAAPLQALVAQLEREIKQLQTFLKSLSS